jgi:integrase
MKSKKLELPRYTSPQTHPKNIFDSGSGYKKKTLIILGLSAFFFYNFSLVSLQVSFLIFLPILIEPDYLTNPKPYREARLVIPHPDALDQRWCVKYYVYDAQQSKVVRKRDFSCNSIKDLKSRKTWCNKFIAAINKKLQEGYHIDKQKSEKQDLERRAKGKKFISIAEATKMALESKKRLRPKTYKNYSDYLTGWLKEQDKNLHIQSVTHKSLKPFVGSLMARVSPRTFNNYIQHLSTLFQYLVEEEIIAENPWVKITKLENGTGKNIAYQKEDQVKLMKYMAKHFPQMELYCKTMYYTLARPNELSHLQIKHIDQYRLKHIFIPAAISKNNTDRHVVLPEPIYTLLKPLKKLNPEWYIFGKGIMPSPQAMDSRYVSDAYRTRVIKPLGFTKEYTLYSWKHTGVVNNYLGGLSPASLRMQIGHNDTGSFEKYLKSLGLFENKEVMENYVKL